MRQSLRLKLASYNIRKCVGLDRRRDPARVARVIAGLRADIVALQEADRRLGDRPAALPRDEITARTGLVPLPLGAGAQSLGWHGNALLLRPGLRATGIERIDLPGLEPRGAVIADLAGDSPAPFVLRVVAVHLGLMRRHRLRQLDSLCERLARLAPMPTVILGDFNEWSSERVLEALGAGFRILAPGRSYHAARPLAALDRIALGPGLWAEDAGVLDEEAALGASDHLPVWATVRVAGTGSRIAIAGPCRPEAAAPAPAGG